MRLRAIVRRVLNSGFVLPERRFRFYPQPAARGPRQLRLPRIVQTRAVAKSRLFNIESVDIEFSNGRRAIFERLVGEGEGAVLVVPRPDPESFLLIREYAVGVERYELGFVKGRIDHGETPEAAAQRELREEIGYGARTLTHLHTVSLTPSYSNYRTHIYLADDLFVEAAEGDEPEPLEVVRWPIVKLDDLRAASDFSDARCHLAICLLKESLL